MPKEKFVFFLFGFIIYIISIFVLSLFFLSNWSILIFTLETFANKCPQCSNVKESGPRPPHNNMRHSYLLTEKVS